MTERVAKAKLEEGASRLEVLWRSERMFYGGGEGEHSRLLSENEVNDDDEDNGEEEHVDGDEFNEMEDEDEGDGATASMKPDGSIVADGS